MTQSDKLKHSLGVLIAILLVLQALWDVGEVLSMLFIQHGWVFVRLVGK